MSNIPNETKEILSTLKSPKLEDILEASLISGYDSYAQNSHNTGVENLQGLERFCKLVYIDWYTNLTENNAYLTGNEKVVSDTLLNNNIFHPSSIENMKGSLSFYKFFLRGYNKYFKDTHTGIAMLQNGDGLIKGENDGKGGEDFLHIYGNKINGQNRGQIDARLYLNLKGDNIPLFAFEAYKKCREANLPFYFKFGIQDNRNDPFLFYTSYENIPHYIKIIEQIKSEHPELLEGTQKISRNLGVLNGYIGYGEEPLIKQDSGNNYSYNSIRNECISAIRVELLHDIKQAFVKTTQNDIFTTNPYPMTFDETCDRLVERYMPSLLNSNVPLEKSAVVEKNIKNRFRSAIKDSLLLGKPMKDINIKFSDKYVATLHTSTVDWISELRNSCDKQFETQTAFRGHAIRYTSLSGKSLSENERKLIYSVKEKLVEGLNEDLQDPTIDNEQKVTIQKYLQKINVPYSEMDQTGRGILLLSTANFLENNILTIQGSKHDFVYPNKMLDIYKDILGKDYIDGIIKDNCNKYHISANNACFNDETEKQLINKTRKI